MVVGEFLQLLWLVRVVVLGTTGKVLERGVSVVVLMKLLEL